MEERKGKHPPWLSIPLQGRIPSIDSGEDRELVATSSSGHVIDGNSASSTLDSHQQPNGSKAIVAGATVEDNNRNLAGDGRHLTFVISSCYKMGQTLTVE